MPAYRVRAYNRSHDSENRIHDDRVAKTYGFVGALVPGVEVYAYLMHAPVVRWGSKFLERGAATCRFLAPVYDGEEVEIVAEERGGVLSLEARSRRVLCATGTASLPADPPASPEPGSFGAAKPPSREARPEANAASLSPGGALSALAFDASDAAAGEYLRDVRETEGLYAREGLVHPGLVLRMCNRVLVESVRLGPWIHVGSEVRNLSAARVGETLSARARIAANYEKKGHRFVEFDALVLADGRPAALVHHTAIYQPRQSAAA